MPLRVRLHYLFLLILDGADLMDLLQSSTFDSLIFLCFFVLPLFLLVLISPEVCSWCYHHRLKKRKQEQAKQKSDEEDTFGKEKEQLVEKKQSEALGKEHKKSKQPTL